MCSVGLPGLEAADLPAPLSVPGMFQIAQLTENVCPWG